MTCKRLLSFLFVGLSILLLSSCHLALLDSKGIVAAQERNFLLIAVGLMLLVVIPVIIMSFIFAWKYRASNKTAKYRPNWGHNNWIEAVCWGIPCLIVIALAIIAWVSSHRLDPYRPLDAEKKTPPVVIQAVALNWKWLFIYPKRNIATVNYIRIPVNIPVKFLVAAADAPMNSLEFPQLAGQIYAMTGMRTKLHLMGNEKGRYWGLSTNYSGDGFATMRFHVDVTSKNDYERWISRVKRRKQSLTQQAYKQLAKPSQANPVTYYSSVKPNLFNDLIMKYMGPDMMGMMTDELGNKPMPMKNMNSMKLNSKHLAHGKMAVKKSAKLQRTTHDT